MAKRGYFFTLDAFVAVFVVSVGIFLIFSAQRFQPYSSQAVFLSQDIADKFASMKLSEADNPFVNDVSDINSLPYFYKNKDLVFNRDNTLLQELGELYYYSLTKSDPSSYTAKASELMEALSSDLVPVQYGFKIRIEGTLIYDSRGFSVETAVPAETSVLISSRRIVFGLVDNSVWGPYKTEVLVWQG